MDRTSIEVMQGPTLAKGIPTVVGVMTAETLIRHHAVPHRDVLRGTGYQRNPSAQRISQLAGSLNRREVDLPTSVLLNIRVDNLDSVLTRIAPDAYALELNPDMAQDEHRLYVVDGQHRIKALERALNEHQADIRNVKIPFVCMVGADEAQEMEQFHVVNSNAKSVPTDLAYDLLRALAQEDPGFMYRLEEAGRRWEVEAQTLTNHLAVASSTWKDKIRLPNTPKANTTVPSGAFVKSLRVLLTQTALFRTIRTIEQQGQVIDAYWRAIRRIMPEAFEDPTRYNLQKGIGVEVLHAVMPSVLDQVRYKGGSLFEPDSYEDLLKQSLGTIEGINGDDELVSGAGFWRAGRQGAAGVYSSAAGKRRLAELIEARLPEPEL